MAAPISSKDKLAYFKDNIQTAEDQDEFDASQYYYNRSRISGPAPGMGAGGLTDVGVGDGTGNPPYGIGFGQQMQNPGFAGQVMPGPPPPVPGPPRSTSVAPDRGMMSAMPAVGGVGPDQLYPQPPVSRSISAPSAPYRPADQLMGMVGGKPSRQPGASQDTHFDLNEFPALAGPGLTADMDGGRFNLQAPEFAMQSEDFPALPGSGPAPGSMAGGDSTQSSQSAFSMGAMHSSSGGLPHSGMGGPGVPGFGAGPLAGARPIPMHEGMAGDSSKPGDAPEMEKEKHQYGLLGLLNVIRMMDPDLNTLALGSDLTTLGLNLNSSKSLYATFASPWADGPSKSEPHFQLPLCYYMQQTPPLKHVHLQKFQLETLFYIFYAMPKDLLQAYAAQELYHRDWRYHVDLRLWFRRATAADGITSHSQPQFSYFDVNSWETRLFAGNIHGNLTAGLMSEEEVRVRVPQP